MSDDQKLTYAAQKVGNRMHELRRARELVADDVARGRLTAEEAGRLDNDQLAEYLRRHTSVTVLRFALEDDSHPKARDVVSAQSDSPLPTEQIIAAFCDLLAIVKAQQNIIQDLTNDRDVFLAHFTDRMFDKVQSSLKDGRDYKGISITLKLSDETTESKERTQAQTDETSAMQSALRDINGEISVLAKQLGGLAAARSVHNEELNKRIATVSKTTRAAASAKWRGEVMIQIGEVTSNTKPRDE